MKKNLGSIVFLVAIFVVIGALAIFYQGQILPKYNNEEIDKFIQMSFETLGTEIGAPEYSIEQVLLIVKQGDTNARSGYVDREGGNFYISLPFVPDSKPKWQTYGAIAHEAMHIYRKSIGDPCMEGLCDLFACQMLDNAGLEGNKWDQYLSTTKHFPFYTETYLMMKELKEVVGASNLNRLFDYLEENVAIQQKHFKLKEWLASLPVDKQEKAKAVLIATKIRLEP